jgi:hypothetical protein
VNRRAFRVFRAVCRRGAKQRRIGNEENKLARRHARSENTRDICVSFCRARVKRRLTSTSLASTSSSGLLEYLNVVLTCKAGATSVTSLDKEEGIVLTSSSPWTVNVESFASREGDMIGTCCCLVKKVKSMVLSRLVMVGLYPFPTATLTPGRSNQKKSGSRKAG